MGSLGSSRPGVVRASLQMDGVLGSLCASPWIIEALSSEMYVTRLVHCCDAGTCTRCWTLPWRRPACAG